MNQRIKEKRWKAKSNGQTTKKQREANKRICKRFPFLIPRQVFSDKIVWDIKWRGEKKQKAYSYTLIDEFPRGWWKAFGFQLCEELREDLIKCNYLYKFRFEQIKEKFGGLRCYTGSLPKESNAWNIIEDYSILSENICISCGKPDVHITDTGWILPICKDCFYKQEKQNNKYYEKKLTDKEIYELYEKSIAKDDDGRMADAYRVRVRQWDRDGTTKDIEYNLKDKAEKIRARWREKHGI